MHEKISQYGICCRLSCYLAVDRWSLPQLAQFVTTNPSSILTSNFGTAISKQSSTNSTLTVFIAPQEK
jgi:hypothetical protein